MDRYTSPSNSDRITFIGNYLPRECGIATFTTDLCEGVGLEERPTCIAMPVNDGGSGYTYPPKLWFEVADTSIAMATGGVRACFDRLGFG